MTAKQSATDRRAQILAAAVTLASKQGYHNITREQIAGIAGISPGLVSKYAGTMTNLRRDVMRAAIRERNLSIIAQGIALHDRTAMRAPDDVKKAALASLNSKGGK